jgi:hypothetical protein
LKEKDTMWVSLNEFLLDPLNIHVG